LKPVSDGPDGGENQLSCIGLDAKVDDKTLMYLDWECEGERKLRKATKPEHHLTFTVESGGSMGNYLCHRNIPLKGATGQVLADTTLSVLKENDSEEALLAILMDNTSLNTGRFNGVHSKLEAMLCRPLHLIGCSLHFNELPLKSILKKLDGCTTGPKTFTGPIGIMTSKDSWLQPIENFEPIPVDLSHVELSDDMNISHDQQLLYQYSLSISGTTVDKKWLHRRIGPQNHARWLTLAVRIMSAYMRTPTPSVTLKQLAVYVATVYAPAWFEFKIKPFLSQCPEILHRMIARLKQMNCPDKEEIVKESFQRNAYFLLPENFIYSLLCSNDRDLRKLGWMRVLESRSSKIPYESRSIPSINFDAPHWSELISSEFLVIEPPCTMKIPTEDILEIMDGRKHHQLPRFPNNSQSVERAVKLVSGASKHVYGLEGRHQMVKLQNMSRQIRPAFNSKGEYIENFSSLYNKI